MATAIVDAISSGFGLITELAGALKDGFTNLLYVDPTAASPVMSGVAQFLFIMLGISFAISIVYGAYRLIKAKA